MCHVYDISYCLSVVHAMLMHHMFCTACVADTELLCGGGEEPLAIMRSTSRYLPDQSEWNICMATRGVFTVFLVVALELYTYKAVVRALRFF